MYPTTDTPIHHRIHAAYTLDTCIRPPTLQYTITYTLHTHCIHVSDHRHCNTPSNTHCIDDEGNLEHAVVKVGEHPGEYIIMEGIDADEHAAQQDAAIEEANKESKKNEPKKKGPAAPQPQEKEKEEEKESEDEDAPAVAPKPAWRRSRAPTSKAAAAAVSDPASPSPASSRKSKRPSPSKVQAKPSKVPKGGKRAK